MSGPEFRGFSNRKEAIAYARETGLPLGRRRPEAYLKKHGLSLYFVGRFSPYHYVTVDLPHRWGRIEALPKYEVCLDCLIVRRADGKNSPCKGKRKVVLR